MVTLQKSEQQRQGILPRAILVIVLLLIALAYMIPAVSADREIIQDIIKYGSPACKNYGMYVKEDMDNNGVFDTLVVFQTINGYADNSFGYFFTVPSAAGSSCAYQPPGRGRYVVYFVDMLAPGFSETNSATWTTFKSFSGVEITGSHNEQQWDYTLPNPYLGISAYRGRNQQDPVSGVHTPPDIPNGFESWSFDDSGGSGIKELYISTDYLENVITQFWIKTQSTGTLSVMSPNGGETWQRGTSHKVTWSYTGSPGSTVKITLLKAGAEVGTIITSTSIGSSGTGSYTWPISSTGFTGSDFKVKVQSISQPGITDTSNNYFTITPAGTVTPTITVTSPNGGQTWQRGTSHAVTWSYTGQSRVDREDYPFEGRC